MSRTHSPKASDFAQIGSQLPARAAPRKCPWNAQAPIYVQASTCRILPARTFANSVHFQKFQIFHSAPDPLVRKIVLSLHSSLTHFQHVLQQWCGVKGNLIMETKWMVIGFLVLKTTMTTHGGSRGGSMPASFYCSLTMVFLSECLVRWHAKTIRAMLLEVGRNRITCLASLLLRGNLLGIISVLHGITSCINLSLPLSGWWNGEPLWRRLWDRSFPRQTKSGCRRGWGWT